MTVWLRLPLVVLFLAGCDASQSQSASIREGTLTDGRYDNALLGWSMPVPPGWTVMSLEDIRSYTGKGREMVEKSLGEPIEENQVDLLYLRGGPHSGFTSARQPVEKLDGPYEEVQEQLFEVLAQAYRTADIPVRVAHRQETIDGVTFELMHVSMRAREDDREVAQQYMYDARLGEHGFTVSITAIDPADLAGGWRGWRWCWFGRVRAATDPASK
jgi:hypothetical protein